MNSRAGTVLDPFDGRTFVIGREGHIYLNDPAVSKSHAEMKIAGGRVRVRDLGSTNGVYFIRGNKAVRFKDEYVEPHEIIAIGDQRHTIESLLAIVDSLSDLSCSN